MSSDSNLANATISRLADRCPTDARTAVDLFEKLLGGVAALHELGRLHGNIAVDTVILHGDGRLELAEPPNEINFTGPRDLTEICPPELQTDLPMPLSCNLATARIELTKAGVTCDPARIDVYQLGAVLCGLLSGQCVSDFLQSAKARSKVPVQFRKLIDGALGYAADLRYQSVSELASELATAAQAHPSASQVASSFSETPVVLSAVGGGPDTPAPRASSAPRTSTLGTGTRLGPYQIVKRIGGGGMGDVYQAYEETLDRYVAIKVLPPEFARQDDFVRRFRAEASAVAKLVHPNVVQIHSIGEEAGHHYFAMQFVVGESLADLLKRRGRLPVDETVAIVEKCLAGLKAAHDRGLIHRDVKPGNILLDHESNRPLLADFGLVKGLENGSSLTATGIILGTVDYIPPEQARGQPIDGRADLYSLGVLMYQMLSGRLPFEANSSTAMIFKHAYEQPPLLSEVAPDVPRRIGAIVTRLLAKNPDHRYQNAAEVLADLEAFRTGKPPAIPQRAVAAGSSIMERSYVLADSGGWESTGAASGSMAISGSLSHVGIDWRSGDWRDRLWSIFRRGAPKLADKLANTTQQVDGAIIEYERRHGELAQLTRDAEEVTSELAAQVASHEEAAREAVKKAAGATPEIAARLQQDERQYEQTAADFAAQLKEHRNQTEDLQMRLAKVAATLKQLRSQRDLLQARLRTAEARIQIESAPGSQRRRGTPWIAVATVVGLLFLAWLGWTLLRGDRTPVEATPAPLQSESPVAVVGPSSGVEPQRTGRLYVGCKGEFEVYVNGVRLSFPDQRANSVFISQPFSLQRGDIVVVRANSRYVYRAIRMEFVSDDAQWCWPVTHSQFVVVGDAPVQAINANLLRKSPVTTLPAKTSPEIVDDWSKLELPQNGGSEWFWPLGQNDKNRWLQFATVVRSSMFKRTDETQPSASVVANNAEGTLQAVAPPTDAVEFNGHHYKLIAKRGITWDDAEAACENAGGHLACPVTPEQLQFVDKIKDGKAVWLGGYFDAAAQSPAWKWLTGQKIDRSPPSAGSTDLWIATMVGDKIGVIGRAQDGTLRKPDGSIMRGLNTNIQGYICEWDH